MASHTPVSPPSATEEQAATAAELRKGPWPLSILDSAVLVTMFSAACYVMGNAAQVSTARRLGVPFSLMPRLGPEIVILVGGTYLTLLFATGLLLYFLWILWAQRIGALRDRLVPALTGMRHRARQYPRVYLLLACLAGAALLYSVPLLLPWTPRAFGGQGSVTGSLESIVVSVKLKDASTDIAGRDLRFLWREADNLLLQDRRSGELLLIREDEVRLLILKRLR